MSDQCGRLLVAALGRAPVAVLRPLALGLRTWLEFWSAIGRVAVGTVRRASTFSSRATTSAVGGRQVHSRGGARPIDRTLQLLLRSELLVHDARLSRATLRGTRERISSSDSLRRAIRLKVRRGELPYEDIPAVVVGKPGDGSICGGCHRSVTPRRLMMLISIEADMGQGRPAKVLILDAECFQHWNSARYAA